MKLPGFQANLKVDVRELFGLPPEKPAAAPKPSVSELAFQKVQEALRSGDRRALIDALQVYNTAVGAHQGAVIAALENPFITSFEIARQLPVIQTAIQRDILANSRDQAKEMATQTTELWGSSHQNDRELRSHFEEVAQNLSRAIDKFDSGNADAAFDMQRRALWNNDAYMAWMGRDLRHSEQLKNGVKIGITAAAGLTALLLTDGAAFAALGKGGAAALSGGSQLGLLIANGAVFEIAHRALEQKILNTPFLRKEGAMANVMDMGGSVVKAAGIMGSIKAAALLAPELLPIAEHETALIAARNFGFEYGAINMHGIATGMDPRLLADAHYHAEQLSFLLGPKAANGVIAAFSAGTKNAESLYTSLIESKAAARLALLPLAALGVFAVPAGSGRRLEGPANKGTELARPKDGQLSGESPTTMDKVVLAARGIGIPFVQNAVVKYAAGRAEGGRGDFIQILISMLGGFSIPELQAFAHDHHTLKNLPTKGNAPGSPATPAPKAHIQIVRVLHQLNVTTPEAIWAIFASIPRYDEPYQKSAVDALIDFANAGSDYARQCLYDIVDLQFTGNISANSLRRVQEYLADHYIVDSEAGVAFRSSSGVRSPVGTSLLHNTTVNDATLTRGGTVRAQVTEQSQHDAVSQLEVLAHSNRQHAVELLFQILKDGTTYWSVATRIVKVLSQLNLKPGDGPKAIVATKIIGTRLYVSHVDEAYGHAAVDLLGKWAMQWPCAQSMLNGVSENPQVPQSVRDHAKTVTSAIPDYLDRVDAGVIPDLDRTKAPADIVGFAGIFGLEETPTNTTSFKALWDGVRRVLIPPNRPLTQVLSEESRSNLRTEKLFDQDHPLRNSTPHRLIASFFGVSIARAEFLLPYIAHLVGSGITQLPAGLNQPEVVKAIETLQRQHPSVHLSRVSQETGFDTQRVKDMLHSAIHELPAIFKPMLDQVRIRARPLTEVPGIDNNTFGAHNDELFIPPMFRDFTPSDWAPQILLFPEVINPSFSAPAAKALAVRLILMHEFGHYLGLDHIHLKQLGLY